MFDAVVTFVTRKGEGSDWEDTITKVYRLEFESEGDFQDWLQCSGCRVLDVQQLRS